MKYLLITTFVISFLLNGCKNKDINEGEEFKPKEINEDYGNFHFNKIDYEGSKYLITERDNNNPHEGFGFMAYNGRDLELKSDSILAYLKSIAEFQKRLYAKEYNVSYEDVEAEYDSLLTKNLKK